MKLKKLVSALVSGAMILGTMAAVPAFADETESVQESQPVRIHSCGGGSIDDKNGDESKMISLLGADISVSSESVTVKTEEELRSAVVDGAKIILGADIELYAGIMIPNNAVVDIDLGDYTLTGADATYVIRATNNSTLTVKNGTIKVGKYEENKNWSWGIDNRGGNVTVDDVVFAPSGDCCGDAVTANWDWDFVSDDEEGYHLLEGGTAASTILNNVTVSENVGYCADRKSVV